MRSRHIVILNWRDIKHPQSGGAEKVTWEIVRRWVVAGHRITWFCASFLGGEPDETIEGVHVVRRGCQMTVHWEAYRYYRAVLKGRCDVIIDQVNTLPFCSPLYAREPVLLFSHQVAREVWHFEAPFPLSAVGYAAEPCYMQVYKRVPVITVSRSTEHDLRRFGLVGPFHRIPEAVDTTPPYPLPAIQTKEMELTLIFVGRVVPSKRIDHLIQALAEVCRKGYPKARLWIVGGGDEKYRTQLNRLIEQLEVSASVTFFGFIDAGLKEELLQKAHIFVMTSVREGWGLAVSEANAAGTPAVVYDVPGLRDSTQHNETGVVCRPSTPEVLGREIVALWSDTARYARLREGAWAFARGLNWDATARAAWAAVESSL